MSDFRKVTESFWASPQIGLSDVAEARMLGFTLIINNRPEGESDDQTSGGEIAEAARAAGMDYCAIPVTHAGFNEGQVEAMVAALDGARGPVLAYCRSGTRSTLLWSLAQAASGTSPEEIALAAAGAGYDVGPIRPLIDTLSARSQA
ncbi:TIGR01244 family phosphatase [Croceibacterium sp. LX-88]|uniref:TIGR01244 family phosphatase n=1 Tax=Croceibacterium selenioxidans TaxID=2838833 RepID=A0ABS5W5X5_9SPHN|nr:TIGR01244 family sulfur transferase [Croceibacterium selenioxidans]MBT2135131.1 TIGR01244 family phosphatase [Croceibacterium selenioxidans]